LAQFYKIIEKIKIDEELNYTAALEKVNSLLYKIAYRYYDSREGCQLHNVFFDRFPFEFNVIGMMKGQPKDFDLLLQRKNDLDESAVIVEYFSNKEIDVIS
jgi:hypothetical protein